MDAVIDPWLGDVLNLSNRWISTRRATRLLERPLPTDRVMFHYRRVLGAIMLAAPILIKGAIFISDVSVADGVRLLARLYSGTKLSRAAWEILWHGMIVVGARPRLWGGVIAILVLW